MSQEKVWDKIAEQWHHFRQQKFQPVYDFIENFKPKKGKILEVGCGNARNLIPFAKSGFECYGIDFSNNMLRQAKKFAQKMQ
ncbi:class I SAM-dependent methyltransferase, partial [Candidatus Woesearchaeota archaeon]|nr:class I SAM-dependent methyltransferase [Candidatus Woesearchaeota archaeon]